MGTDRAEAARALGAAGAVNDRGYWHELVPGVGQGSGDEDQFAAGPASANCLVGAPRV
jgi:hypothetical protein